VRETAAEPRDSIRLTTPAISVSGRSSARTNNVVSCPRFRMRFELARSDVLYTTHYIPPRKVPEAPPSAPRRDDTKVGLPPTAPKRSLKAVQG